MRKSSTYTRQHSKGVRMIALATLMGFLVIPLAVLIMVMIKEEQEK